MSTFDCYTRYQIYITALELFQKDLDHYPYAGLCHCLYDACTQLGVKVPGEFGTDKLRNLEFVLPEFLAEKPKDGTMYGLFWWKVYETEPRIKALNRMINKML